MIAQVTSSGTLPATIKPMLASLVRQPFNSPNHIFELKWDGIRTLAFIQNGQVRLQSRNLQNITSEWPELSCLPQQVIGDKIVLDGELVYLNQQGYPSFQGLQPRLQRKPKILPSMRKSSLHYIAFDILFYEGQSVMEQSLGKRKNLLHEVIKPNDVVQACDFIENDGEAFFQAVCKHGLEGIMAKEKSSLYFPGTRSSNWLKVKRVRESEFVIGGYTFGGQRELFTSLLLGLYDQQRLLYVGLVGTGFSEVDLKTIFSLLQPLQTSVCPFSETPAVQKFIYWCEPKLVCQVRYGEFTLDRKLRYPVFLSLRQDKSPFDCTIADAPGWPRQKNAPQVGG